MITVQGHKQQAEDCFGLKPKDAVWENSVSI